MGIFKKPKVLMIAGAVALAVIIAAFFLLSPSKPKSVGVFGADPQSQPFQLLQKQLDKAGYTLTFANAVDEVTTDCEVWIVRTESEEVAQQIADAVGKKAIFIERKPALAQAVRFVGWDMEGAGMQMAGLLSRLPLGGDSNEDGTVSCLVLTSDAPQWQLGLDQGLVPLSVEVLQTLSCDLTEDAAKAVVTEALAQYGRDIEVILVSDDILATGAAAAIAGRGWVQGEDFYLLSTSCTESSLNALNEAQRSGLVLCREADFANTLYDAVMDAIRGGVPKEFFASFQDYQ